MSLVFLWSLVIYILFGQQILPNCMHVLDMSDTVILYLDMWSVSNGIIGDQQSILSIHKKQIIVQKNSYLQIYIVQTFQLGF